MSVVNLSCPKCSHRATEYDQHKWQCLAASCGIKFLYEPIREGQPTVRNTQINVDSESQFELDVGNAVKAKVITLSDRDIKGEEWYLTKQIGIQQYNEDKKAEALAGRVWTVIWSIILGVLTFYMIKLNVWFWTGPDGMWAFPTTISGWVIRIIFGGEFITGGLVLFGAMTIWLTYSVFFPQQYSIRSEDDFKRKANEKQDFNTEVQPLCPHCRSEVKAREELNHCFSCGKQFYYKDSYVPRGGTSYPLKDKNSKSDYPLVIPLPGFTAPAVPDIEALENWYSDKAAGKG